MSIGYEGWYVMCQVSHVVNTIVHQAKKESISLSPMKLQKILYFLYKEYYKEFNQALFPERFEAWMYGPVVSDVYYAYQKRRKKNITEYMQDAGGNLKRITLDSSPDFQRVFIDVWDRCKCYSGIELSKLTHSQDSAWTKAVTSNKAFLDDDDIEAEPAYI